MIKKEYNIVGCTLNVEESKHKYSYSETRVQIEVEYPKCNFRKGDNTLKTWECCLDAREKCTFQQLLKVKLEINGGRNDVPLNDFKRAK